MLFSVVVPTYNVAEYIEKTIESIIRAQDMYSKYDVELLVIDDESTDETVSIVNRYQDKYDWIRVLRQLHKGLGAARNFGVSQVSGEYVLFVDGDDSVSQDIFLSLSKVVHEKSVDLVVFKWRSFGGYNNDVNDYGEFTVQGAWIACWNKCYRRDLITDEKFPEDVVYEDTGFFISAWYRSKSKAFVDETLYFYRHRNDGLSKRPQKFDIRLNCLVGFKEALIVSDYATAVKTIVVETIIKHINRSIHSGQMLNKHHKNEIKDFFEEHDLYDALVFKNNNLFFRKWLHWTLASRSINALIGFVRCKVWFEKVIKIKN